MTEPQSAKARYKTTAVRHTERLNDAGIQPSVGSKGDSYDNTLAETINVFYKKPNLLETRGDSPRHQGGSCDEKLHQVRQ